MKKLYFLLILSFFLSKANAQWVTIPDPNFAAYLQQHYPSCMNGNQMNIQCNAIINATGIDCSFDGITDLTGIEYFTSLQYLNCSWNSITSLTNLPNTINNLDCKFNPLTSISTLPDSLLYFDCRNTGLTTLPTLPTNLYYFRCGFSQLTSLPNLPNSITFIDCVQNQLTTLPSLPNDLISFYCTYNQLTSLPPLPNKLKYLYCFNNQLTSLPSLPDSLEILHCYDNQLSSLPVLNDNLQDLRCYNNQLDSLPSLPNSLYYLGCSYNQIISLPNLPNSLYTLHCSNNFLTSLPALPQNLGTLDCSFNQIDSLTTLPNNIYYLDCSNNQLTTIPNLSEIMSLKCSFNQLTSLPELPDTLIYFWINDNPNLSCLPKLNYITNFDFTNTNIECLPNYPYLRKHNGIDSIVTPSLSTFTLCEVINLNNCDVYWNLSGKVFSDFNNDCQIDSGELGLKNLKINLYSNGNLIQQNFSVDDGLYSIFSDTGAFTYTIDTIGIPVIVTCPVLGYHSSIITLNNFQESNKDFAMQCKSGIDIGVKNIVGSGQFFPANYATIKVGAGDMGNFYGLNCAVGVSGTVTININGPVTYISEAPGALVPVFSGNTILTYNISDFGTVNFNTDFRFIVQTDTLTQAGDQICFIVNVTPTTGDNDTTNNSMQHCFTVVNSFDPNDKLVFPSGDLLPDHEWLTYTIRFQNTGTAPAQHIYILDTLNNNLDVSTFTLLSYSHDNLTQVLGDVVKFNFPNINLPDSTNDEPNSHGYVQYKIKLNPGLPIGTIISNTAYNFFDFNPPIATNTVQNQIYFLNPTITPNNLILCPNESDTLWTQVYDSYQWFKDGNLIPGANNQYLVVDYFNDSGSQFIVEVDSAGVIAQSPPVLVDGWVFLPPFVITEGTFTIGSMGEVIICPGDTVYLILGQPYETNIQWTENGIAIPGATNDTLVVIQAGLYHVTGSPAQCPNYVQGLFTDIEVITSAPLSPTITPNNLILCPNESDTLWTQQFGTYQWYKDGNLIPGATNQYLVVEQFNDAGSQFYVVVSDGNCTGSSSQVLVDSWIFLLPYVISEGTFTVGPNGEMLMCPGDTAYLILGQPYDTSIQWTESGNIIPGANNDTLVVTQTGNYHVSGAPSTCPNFIQNLGVTIEVIVQGPPTPVITLTGNTLQTQSGFSNYQWYYNGNPVGINSNTLQSQGAGTYTVTITDAQGCSATSQTFVVTAIIETISGVVNVNYNIQNSTLQITRTITTSETQIFVLDVLGRMIADERMARGKSEIQIKLTNIKPGIYFVNLSEGGNGKFFVE